VQRKKGGPISRPSCGGLTSPGDVLRGAYASFERGVQRRGGVGGDPSRNGGGGIAGGPKVGGTNGVDHTMALPRGDVSENEERGKGSMYV